jgi:hypothetical protein
MLSYADIVAGHKTVVTSATNPTNAVIATPEDNKIPTSKAVTDTANMTDVIATSATTDAMVFGAFASTPRRMVKSPRPSKEWTVVSSCRPRLEIFTDLVKMEELVSDILEEPPTMDGHEMMLATAVPSNIDANKDAVGVLIGRPVRRGS